MNERTKHLILLISQEMERANHAGRGRIKLSKLLWRCDFAAYWRLGKPITDATYVADTLGPKPAGEREITNEMIADGDFRWDAGFDQQKIPKALTEPDLDLFTAAQLRIVEGQLDQYRSVTGTQMADEAHEFVGYRHAYVEGEWDRPIPFESVFWADRDELEPWEEEHAALLAADS